MRKGEHFRLGGEPVQFGKNIVVQTQSGLQLQHRFFVNDPWELIAEALHRSIAAGRVRDIAHSFRRQAEDYFRAASVGRELAVKPVLLYYAFVNLSKAYALAKGNITLAEKAFHGIKAIPKSRAILGSLIRFDTGSKGVFQLFLRYQNGNHSVTKADLKLGYLLPQILPGHRLWCYATKYKERFFSVERLDLLHDPDNKEAWLNVHLDRTKLERLGLSETLALSHSGMAHDFELVAGLAPRSWICFQQRIPEPYTIDPVEAIPSIIAKAKNLIWDTVRLESPYRKPYLYCSPVVEWEARLPQLLSVYLLMFFLGSVTRYSPGYFESMLDSRFGPFFDTFISESPMQFLYLMASEILGREVSKPAII